jgi:outer membrane protein
MISAATGVEIAKGNLMPTLNLSGNLNTSSSSRRVLYDAIPAGFDTIGTVAGTGNPVVSNELDFRLEEQDYPMIDQFQDNFNQSVSIQLNIPIFNSYRFRNAVTQAEINRKRAELNLEQRQTDLRNNIYQAYTQARAAQKRLQSAEKNVNAARKSFEYTNKKAEQGLVRPIDFQNAQSDLQRAESNMVQAKYQYLMSIRILNFYLGKTLKTQN